MENLIITEQGGGYFKVSAAPGYKLFNEITQRYYSVAIVKDTRGYVAILDGIPPEPHPRTLQDAITEKLAALNAYDSGPAVNSFSIGGNSMWIVPALRDNYLSTIQSERRLGGTTIPFQGVELPLDMAENILDQINRYARLCYDKTEEHKAAIRNKRKIETVDAYDFTVGYPEKLVF